MPNAEGRMEVTERDIDYVVAVMGARHGEQKAAEADRVALRWSIGAGNWPIAEYRAVAEYALSAARAENERLREENVAADGTARAAVELVQDCREVLGLDRGASLTAAVMRAAKDARRYHALRVFLRLESIDRRWQVTADADDLLNALAATYSFDAREDVNIDAAIDALAAPEGTR